MNVNLKSISLLFGSIHLLGMLSVAGHQQTAECHCPLKDGELRRLNTLPIHGPRLTSISYVGDRTDKRVFAILSGEIVKVNNSVGSLTIKNDSLTLRYNVIDLDSNLSIGDTITAGEQIGVLNKYFGTLHVVLDQGEKGVFYDMAESLCK